MNRRHVHEEAARESHVTGDASALFAERFFRDLDDDVLTGLQHFGNELRTAWRAGTSALIAAVVSRAARAAGASFEPSTRASAARTSGASTTITTTAAIVASTIASTAPEGALEA